MNNMIITNKYLNHLIEKFKFSPIDSQMLMVHNMGRISNKPEMARCKC